MKKVGWSRFFLVGSIFLFLIVVLLMVMDYKINYQYLLDKKLYFYECDSNLCVLEVKSDNYLLYSEYDCGDENCPIYKQNLEEDYVLLTKDEKTILYNYRTGKVISQDYEEYLFFQSNYIIVTLNGFQGVIDLNNQLLVPLQYHQIGYYANEYLSGYNLQNIIVKKDDKYGIISYKTGEVIEKIEVTGENINILLEKLKEEN